MCAEHLREKQRNGWEKSAGESDSTPPGWAQELKRSLGERASKRDDTTSSSSSSEAEDSSDEAEPGPGEETAADEGELLGVVLITSSSQVRHLRVEC